MHRPVQRGERAGVPGEQPGNEHRLDRVADDPRGVRASSMPFCTACIRATTAMPIASRTMVATPAAVKRNSRPETDPNPSDSPREAPNGWAITTP